MQFQKFYLILYLYLSEHKISKKFFEYILLISTAAMFIVYLYELYFLELKYPGWSGRYYGTSNNPISYGNIVMTLGVISLCTFAYNLQKGLIRVYPLLSFFICFLLCSLDLELLFDPYIF